jgi:hypothetical protein
MTKAERKANLIYLQVAIAEATGPSTTIDKAVAHLFDGDADIGYSASVDACLLLIGRVLPDWHWHVGYGPTGVLPYASMQDEHSDKRVETSAPTVPLALLGCVVKAHLPASKGPHGT